MSEKIALAPWFVGRGKPWWSDILAQLKTELSEIQRKRSVQVPNGPLYLLKLNVVLIIAELMAKPNLLKCTNKMYTMAVSAVNIRVSRTDQQTIIC